MVRCSWVCLYRWWQSKLAFVSGMSPRANQFLRSWRHNAVLLMEVSLLLWSDQSLPEIPNGLGAQPSLLISHFHSHCHSSRPSYLLSGLPAALITFGLTSLKITLQSLRFLKLPFYHVTLMIKSLCWAPITYWMRSRLCSLASNSQLNWLKPTCLAFSPLLT